MLTIFADDYHAAGRIESLHELEQFLNCVVVLFKVLKSFGMAVSDTKSQAVLALRGTLGNSIRSDLYAKVQMGPFYAYRCWTGHCAYRSCLNSDILGSS